MFFLQKDNFRKLTVISVMAFFLSFTFCENDKYEMLNSLLSGYLENDLELQKYTLLAESASLDYDSEKIKNGITLSLSSGEIKIKSSSDSTKISVTPNATLSLPMLNGTSVTSSFPISIDDGEKIIKNGNVSVQTGIISNYSKERKIKLLESQRVYLEAEESVRNQVLKAEKTFYESLKKLYNYAIQIYNTKSDLYDDTLNLKVLETQGYSKKSAKYRQALLKVQSGQRSINENQRSLERETALFAMKCGKTYSRDVNNSKKNFASNDDLGELAFESVLSFLPKNIPNPETVNIFDYDSAYYSKIENASWNRFIAEKKREADYKTTLDASLSYVFNDDFYNKTGTNSASDSVETKLNWKLKGISASVGIGIPTGNTVLSESSSENSYNPYYSLNFQFNPNEWRLSKINTIQQKIDSTVEDIEIQASYDDYETEVLDKVSTLHDIKWSQKAYAQEYDMYVQLEKDMSEWLKQGIVTESDYIEAYNNREKLRLNILINNIEQIIYNNDVKLLFCTKNKVDLRKN